MDEHDEPHLDPSIYVCVVSSPTHTHTHSDPWLPVSLHLVIRASAPPAVDRHRQRPWTWTWTWTGHLMRAVKLPVAPELTMRRDSVQPRGHQLLVTEEERRQSEHGVRRTRVVPSHPSLRFSEFMPSLESRFQVGRLAEPGCSESNMAASPSTR